MAKHVIGVDVGTNAVRAVEIVTGDSPRLHRFGQVALPLGAVSEGEVVDVIAVSDALKRLWREVGFGSKSVRVGLASPRVILRIVDIPMLNDAETRSALALQLDDYVPIRMEDTVFDFQPLPASDDPGPDRRILLAAAHQDAVRPLVEAVRSAGLRVAAVDVVPAALARSFHDPDLGPDLVDVVVSVGGGTVVVVAARDGLPMFARTITNVSGRSITERIATGLAVSDVEAERFKRGDLDGIADADTAGSVRAAAEPAIVELLDEVRDSLEFFSAQPGALPVRRILLTGGGSLIEDLDFELSERLGLPVELADPFGRDLGVPTGFELTDLPFLAPYVATAIGIALAGGSRSKTLDLTPTTARQRSTRRGPFLVGATASILLLSTGGLYVQRRGIVGDEEARRESVALDIAAAQAAATPVETATGDPAEMAASVVRSVAGRDVDWLATTLQLEALSSGVDVDITSVEAVAEQPLALASAVIDPAAVDPAPGAPTDAPAAAVAAGGESGSGALVPSVAVARLSVAGTAADANVVAAWLDALATDPRFTDVWVSGLSAVPGPDGTAVTQFSAQMSLTGETLVLRPFAEESA